MHDCRAGIELLGRPLSRSGRRALAALLDSARRPRWRVWAAGAPYGKRAILKGRGYRWSDGNDGRPKSWYADVADDAIESERQYLRDEIYGRHVEIEQCRITAFERYSGRLCVPKTLSELMT